MEHKPFHICCNVDDNYARHCGVMLCSLFENNPGVLFEIHILISSLTNENSENLEKLINKYQSICHFHVVDTSILEGVRFREQRPVSLASYFRILISSLIDKDIHRILYLDTDMVILGDVTTLFSLELDGYALAAVKDPIMMTDELRFQLSLPHGAPYFNAGLMLINIDFWREHEVENRLIEFAKKERKVINHDQDVLNAAFHGKWFALSPQWNRYYPYILDKSFFENTIDQKVFHNHPRVIHYVDFFKPWNKFYWLGLKWNKYRGYYYKYLKLTPWKGTKPKKLTPGKYQKFSLYAYLITYSFKSMFLSSHFFLFHKLPTLIERIIFIPFLMLLKIYYLVNLSKKA